MIKREKKNVDASLWSRRSDIFIFTNETNRSKLSSRKFPWNQYLLIFEGKLEEVETWTCGTADSASEHSPIRKSYPIENEKLAGRKSRFENWGRRRRRKVEKKGRANLFFSLFFSSPPRKSTSDSRANERVKVRRQRASVSANISSRAEYPTEILGKLSKI